MKNLLIIIVILAVSLGCFYFMVVVADSLNHGTYKTVKTEEITVLHANDAPIFVPKGAYILGVAHEYVDVDGRGEPDNPKVIPEGKTNKEYLIKTWHAAVVYWSLDQENEAQNLLNK